MEAIIVELLAKYNAETKSVDWFKFIDEKDIRLSDKLTRSLEKMKIEQLNSITSFNNLKKTCGITTKEVFDFSQAVQNGSFKLKEGQTVLQGYQSYLQSTAKATTIADLKTKALTTSMQLLSTIGWMAAITAATWLIGKLIGSINDAIHASEIAREKSSELTEAWNSENVSIDNSIKKYKDLKEKLDDTSLSAAEVKNLKTELASVQDTLIEKYGQEALQIDLVNGKYDEQIAKLNTLSREKAKAFVAENHGNIEADRKFISNPVPIGKNLGYQISMTEPFDFSKTFGFDIEKYLSKYKSLDLNVLDNSGVGAYGEISLVGNGTREDLREELTGLFSDLSDDLGNDNPGVKRFQDAISALLGDDVLSQSAIDKAKKNVMSYAEAEILSRNNTRQAYENALGAVEKYNNALASGEGIEKAKSNLDSVKKSVTNITKDISGADVVFDEIYSGINKTAETVYKLNHTFENDKGVQSFAEKLKGLSDEDLLKIDFEDAITSPGEEAFDSLIRVLDLSEDEVQSLIDKLVELGYVEEMAATPPTFVWSEKINKQIDDVQSKIQTLRSALDSLNTGDLNTEGVLDLIQEFPVLNDYVDMSQENFGNLKQGLEELIRTQPDELISSLQNMETASEEDQLAVDNLISSLQTLADITIDYSNFDTMADGLNDVESAVTSLVSAMNQLKEGTALSKGEIAKLALEYPQLLEASNLFTDGSVQGQKAMLNSVLDMYEQQYDAIIDEKIAELQATNQCLSDQIDLEEQKMNKVLEIEALQDTGKLETEEAYNVKLNELRDLEGRNFVSFSEGTLKVNADSLSKQLEQEDEKGKKAEPVWQAQQKLISNSFVKGGEGGLTALNTLGGRVASWVNKVATNFRGLANTISQALVGKQIFDESGFDAVNTNLSANVGNTTYNSPGNFTINGKSPVEFKAEYEENNKLIVESLKKEIEKNNNTINNLEQLKGLDLTEISSDKAGSGSGSGSKTESKGTIFDWIEEKIKVANEEID